MCNSLIYDIYPITTSEYGFRTQYDIVYDAYFLNRNKYLSNMVSELFPELTLWEFGFDRFMFNKGTRDPKISNTLNYILSSFLNGYKIVYSRVYNPVGQHDVLNRLYIQNLRKNAKNYIPFSIYFKTSLGEEYILIVFYSMQLNMSIRQFLKCIKSIISFCFEEESIYSIQMCNILNLKRVDLSLINQ